MGEALIRGFLKSKASSPGRICASIKDFQRAEALERVGIGKVFNACENGTQEVAEASDIIFLCTKVGGWLAGWLAGWVGE